MEHLRKKRIQVKGFVRVRAKPAANRLRVATSVPIATRRECIGAAQKFAKATESRAAKSASLTNAATWIERLGPRGERHLPGSGGEYF